MQIAADLGFEVVERDIARGELYQADEVFLTGTAAEIVPVREIDDHLLGPPGELTQAIQTRFFEAIKGKRDGVPRVARLRRPRACRRAVRRGEASQAARSASAPVVFSPDMSERELRRGAR